MPTQRALNNLTKANQKKAARTLCARGHYNWKVFSDGKRRCMTCKKRSREAKIKREPLFGLRDIEIDVMYDISHGFPVVLSAERHNYSIQSIKALRAKVRRKLNAYDNAEAVAILMRHKLIQ